MLIIFILYFGLLFWIFYILGEFCLSFVFGIGMALSVVSMDVVSMDIVSIVR